MKTLNALSSADKIDEQSAMKRTEEYNTVGLVVHRPRTRIDEYKRESDRFVWPNTDLRYSDRFCILNAQWKESFETDIMNLSNQRVYSSFIHISVYAVFAQIISIRSC